MKICATCKISKEIDEFGIDKSNKDGYTYHCKECRNKKLRNYYIVNRDVQKERNLKYREKRKEFYSSAKGIESSRRAHLKSVHKITLEEYNILLEKQGNVCDICKKEEKYERNKFLCVDHNHETGKIRGLLCNNCNRALGLLKDDITILENAINYLKINDL